MRRWTRAGALALAGWGSLAWAAPRAQKVDLEDVRLLYDHGELLLVEAGVPLKAGRRGELLAEFDFRSDQQNEQGEFIAPDMKVLWKLETAEGPVLVNGLGAPGDEWNGVLHPVEVAVLHVDRTSGAARGSLSIPIGGTAPPGGLGRFPLLVGGVFTATFVMGWADGLGLDETGEPVNALASALLRAEGVWPQVWLGSEVPRGAVALGGDPHPYFLALSAPAGQERSFTIESQPPGRVQVLDPLVGFGPDQAHRIVRVRGIAPGAFRLYAREGAEVVAESAENEVVQGARYFDADGGANLALEIEAAVEAEQGPRRFCIPLSVLDGPSTPKFTICGECESPPAGIQPCPGDGATVPGTIVRDGKCVPPGESFCHIALTPISGDPYVFDSSMVLSCGSATVGGTFAPWGIGGSGSTTRILYSVCCTYRYDPNSAPVSGSAIQCYD